MKAAGTLYVRVAVRFLLLCAFVAGQFPANTQKTCEDKSDLCPYWVRAHFCQTIPNYISNYCLKSCGFCSPGFKNVAELQTCVDQNEKCPEWAQKGECGNNPNYMIRHCKNSCKICLPLVGTQVSVRKRRYLPCFDKRPDCYLLASKGECFRSKQYMLMACPRTCNACSVSSDPVAVPASCVDSMMQCPAWAQAGQCQINPTYMLPRCRASCRVCSTVQSAPVAYGNQQCSDNNGMCPTWAGRGECGRNPAYMHVECKASCGLCRMNQVQKPIETTTRTTVRTYPTSTLGTTKAKAYQSVSKTTTWPQTTVTNAPDCADQQSDCAKLAKEGQCNKDPDMMFQQCKKTCSWCEESAICRDLHELCGTWSLMEECQLNEKYMSLFCRYSCGLCDDDAGVSHVLPKRLKPIPTYKDKSNGKIVMPCNEPDQVKRIVNGEVSQLYDRPWMVAFFRKADPSQAFCGGALLTNRWVLTAAHCFDRFTKDKIFARVGELDIIKNEGNEKDFDIATMEIHRGYSKTSLDYDIALIQLNGSVAYSRAVSPICLPSNTRSFSTGTMCSVAGWGSTKQDGHASKQLLYTKVPIVSSSKCKKSLVSNGEPYSPRMFCAGYDKPTSDSCQGDSGGPLVCTTESGQDVAYGVVSFSPSGACAALDVFTVYTNVTMTISWISKTILEKTIT